MSSRAVQAADAAIDFSAEVLADLAGCTDKARPAGMYHPSDGVKLRLYPSTTGAGGYVDAGDKRVSGPQTNVARAWANRCGTIRHEAAELQHIVAGQVEGRATSAEPITFDSWWSVGLAAATLWWSRGKGLYRAAEAPPGGPGARPFARGGDPLEVPQPALPSSWNLCVRESAELFSDLRAKAAVLETPSEVELNIVQGSGRFLVKFVVESFDLVQNHVAYIAHYKGAIVSMVRSDTGPLAAHKIRVWLGDELERAANRFFSN